MTRPNHTLHDTELDLEFSVLSGHGGGYKSGRVGLSGRLGIVEETDISWDIFSKPRIFSK